MTKLSSLDDGSMPGFNAARVETALTRINPKMEYEKGSKMWFHCVIKCAPCTSKVGSCISRCWGKSAFFPCVANCLGMKGAEHCVQCIECFVSG